MTFYNDNEPFVCQWTRNLMAAGLISKGTVDERSITELKGNDLAGYERCHFFSGIAGWEAALNIAGWDGPVWSASLPCPAFSCAGKSEGFADARGQLWIPFLRLVKECRPRVIVGEQVPAAIRHGWLDRVFTDLETEGYTCGACVLGAHSAGAPHKRQRIYWVAHTGQQQTRWRLEESSEGSATNGERASNQFGGSSPDDGLADSELNGSFAVEQSGREADQGRMQQSERPCFNADWLAQPASGGREQGHREQPPRTVETELGLSGAEVGRMGKSDSTGSQQRKQTSTPLGHGHSVVTAGNVGVALGDSDEQGSQGRCVNSGEHTDQWSAWSASQSIQCADGKRRRIPLEPAFQPLVANGDGSRNRVGILRASGNSLCIPTAVGFIQAVMEVLHRRDDQIEVTSRK